MTTPDKKKAFKIDERNHVELPLLEQLKGLGWEIIDLDTHQSPADTYRDSFTEMVMLPVLRDQLERINPWLAADQVDEVIKQLTASFPSTNLLENNRYVHNLLLENTSVSENRQTGERSPTVRIIDFADLKNNRYIAVCQFKVRILGTEKHVYPDIVLFVNGLPLVVIECKSPKTQEPLPEAIDQMLRYSEQRGASQEGVPRLFYYNQFVVATCRNECKFGTITTHLLKHFYRWADPYPLTVDDLAHGSSSPNDQQRLVVGMLSHRNLLDLLRTYTLFSTNDRGEIIKIVGRYQQFRAAKLAVQRLLTKPTPRTRSGIIWHTQGAGKSLTMMFMVREMYRHPELAAWKIVFVTDRTQLEQQLADTGQSIGFTVKPAESISDLKTLLRTDSSDLVMAMIHKFQERELEEVFPVLNESSRILVMTDEAHRSQYKLLGANLDRALPNATHIGYTGTPTDKTERRFGDYIDRYTMRESIEDGVTLEIIYEGRTHNAETPDKVGMDQAFEDVFSEYNIKERLEILGFGSRDAYLEAQSTVTAKAKDMVEHYLSHVFPNGFKAQVVATSREAAVRYKNALDGALSEAITALEQNNPLQLNLERLKRLQTDVVISSGHNDLPHLKQYGDGTRHKRSIKSFKLPFDGSEGDVHGDIGILIVNNMLLTGFDAPIEQVLYLDQVMQAHTLLQAITRVNRVASNKEKGFVVDYVGIGHHLKSALNSYDEREQKDVFDSLSFPEEELQAMQDAHRAVMSLLTEHGLTDLSDHDAFYDLFYDEDIRFAYMLAFRELTRCLNLLYPAKESLNFIHDYERLAEINALAARHFGDKRMSMKGIPEKLRSVTDVHLESRGIEQKVEPIAILDEKFEHEVATYQRTRTKAAAIEHAIRHHIDVELDDDPELQASCSEALEEILRIFQNNWERIYEELEKLRQRMKNAEGEPTYGLHKKKQMPFFRMLRREIFNDADLDDDQISQTVDLTQQVVLVVEREIRLTGFWESTPARNRLIAELQKLLLSDSYRHLPGVVAKRKEIISRIMELAKKNHDAILYAP